MGIYFFSFELVIRIYTCCCCSASLSLSLALPERRGRLNFDGNELFDFTGLRWLPPCRSFFFLKVSSRGFGFRFLGIGSGEAAGAVRKTEREGCNEYGNLGRAGCRLVNFYLAI